MHYISTSNQRVVIKMLNVFQFYDANRENIIIMIKAPYADDIKLTNLISYPPIPFSVVLKMCGNVPWMMMMIPYRSNNPIVLLWLVFYVLHSSSQKQQDT